MFLSLLFVLEKHKNVPVPTVSVRETKMFLSLLFVLEKQKCSCPYQRNSVNGSVVSQYYIPEDSVAKI
jgi:hypothetical protein